MTTPEVSLVFEKSAQPLYRRLSAPKRSRVHSGNWRLSARPTETEAQTAVHVRALTDVEDALREIEALLKSGEVSPTLFITPARVFNQPDVRAAHHRLFSDGRGDVLVEDPRQVTRPEVERMANWVADIFRKRATAGTAAAPTPDTVKVEAAKETGPYLDISAQLRDPHNGRLNAKKVAQFFGLKLAELAGILGHSSKQNLSQNPTSAGVQEALSPFEDAALGLFWFRHNRANFLAWLNKPNRDFVKLEGRHPSPLDLIRMGHVRVVANHVRNLLLGQSF
jgi:hypothetical protein